MGSKLLQVQVLVEHPHPSRVGTRLTYQPQDLLAGCSFDADEGAARDESAVDDHR